MLPGQHRAKRRDRWTSAFWRGAPQPARSWQRSDFGQAVDPGDPGAAAAGAPCEAEVAVASSLLSSRPLRCELRDES